MRSLRRAGRGGVEPWDQPHKWQQPALHELAACYGQNLHNTLQRCRKPRRPPAGCTVGRSAGCKAAFRCTFRASAPPSRLHHIVSMRAACTCPPGTGIPIQGSVHPSAKCPARRARLDSTAAFLHAPAPWWALEGEPPVRYLLPTRALPAPARLRRCTTSMSCAQCSQKRWNYH